jgi:hypothetical protein
MSCKGRPIGSTRVVNRYALWPMSARESDEVRWLEHVRIYQQVEESPIDVNMKRWANMYFV